MENGQEVINLKLIAINYLNGRFFVDFLASIPFDYLALLFSFFQQSSSIFSLISLLKLVRVLRLSRIITYLNIRKEIKISLRLSKMIFFMILYLHCLACSWFYIVNSNKDWVPPFDYMFVGTEFYNKGEFYQYTASLYQAILMLGGNDIGPRDSVQFIFTAFALAVGAIINATLFGNMSVMLESLNRKSEHFQGMIDTADEAMKNLNMPVGIMDDVKYYLSYTRSTYDHQKDLDKFLAMISPSLRQRVTHHIFNNSIGNNEVFKGQDHALESLILPHLKIKLFMPEEEIIRQSEQAKSMFFISKGECDVLVLDSTKEVCITRILEKGEYFGEISLLKNTARTATVQSKNYITLAELDNEYFRALCHQYPSIKQAMERKIMKYSDKWKNFVESVLMRIDYLSDSLTPSLFDKILYQLKTITINQGSYLFKRNEICNSVYIIANGEMDMIAGKRERDEKVVETLSKKSVIGIYYSFTNEPYILSAKAKTD